MRSYLKFSSAYNRFDKPEKLKSFLTKTYHVVEKGLTMPQTRLGFGIENVKKLLELCTMYEIKGYDQTALEYSHSVNVLNEYVSFHEKNNFSIDPDVIDSVKLLTVKSGFTTASQQKSVSKEDFFKNSKSSFDEFSQSRYTVRNFTPDDIPLETLHHCVELAQRSPSPCNRQPNRVYIIKDKILMEEVFKLQNGNRGFGHLGNALLVFTSDLSVFHDTYERNEMYLNSGMFSMSLIYALHFYKIGSCALNWSVPIHKDLALKKLLNIPDNEAVTLTLVCGYVPDEFKIALSPKLGWRPITTDLL